VVLCPGRLLPLGCLHSSPPAAESMPRVRSIPSSTLPASSTSARAASRWRWAPSRRRTAEGAELSEQPPEGPVTRQHRLRLPWLPSSGPLVVLSCVLPEEGLVSQRRGTGRRVSPPCAVGTRHECGWRTGGEHDRARGRRGRVACEIQQDSSQHSSSCAVGGVIRSPASLRVMVPAFSLRARHQRRQHTCFGREAAQPAEP